MRTATVSIPAIAVIFAVMVLIADGQTYWRHLPSSSFAQGAERLEPQMLLSVIVGWC